LRGGFRQGVKKEFALWQVLQFLQEIKRGFSDETTARLGETRFRRDVAIHFVFAVFFLD
jgi:hypothetical protein